MMQTFMIAPVFAGLALLTIPATIPAAGVHALPSPLAVGLAYLAAFGAAVLIFALVVGVGGLVHAIVTEKRVTEGRRADHRNTTREPDPLESYPAYAERSSVIVPPPIIPPTSIVPVAAWIHAPGSLPVPFNPLGPSGASMRIPE